MSNQRTPITADMPMVKRGFTIGESARHVVPLVLALVLVGVFSQVTSGQFFTVRNLENVFEQVAVLGMLSVGATLLLIAGQLDLSVASAVSLLAVIAAKLVQTGTPETVILVIVIAGGALIGAFNGLVVTYTRVEPFIFTLGMLSALAAIAALISNNAPVQSGLAFVGLSTGSIGPVPIPAAIFLGCALAAWVILRYTRLGRNAYLIGSNEEAAFLAGVPVGPTKIMLYTISGALAGAAAILLIARLGSGDPQGAAGLELQAITAVVLGGATLAGGRGSVLGTVIGVLLLGAVRNALTLAGVSSSWATLTLGLILMIAVVWAALSAHPQRWAALLRRRERLGAPPRP